MRIIDNLIQAIDDEIISAMDDSSRIVTRGHWFNDNILALSNEDGYAKEGYIFVVQDEMVGK